MGWPYDPQQEETCPACDGRGEEDGCEHCDGDGYVRDSREANAIRKAMRAEAQADSGPDEPDYDVDDWRLP